MKRALFAAAAVLCVVLTLTTARSAEEDTFWYQGGSTTVTPGTPFTFSLWTQDERPIRLQVYHLSADEAIALLGGKPHDVGALAWAGFANRLRSEERWGREVSIGPFPTGLYEIRATLGRTTRAIFANVSTLGLLRLNMDRGSAVWAIDLRTFRRHQGPTAMRLVDKSVQQRRAADIDGVAVFSVPVSSAAYVVAHTADGSTDISGPVWYDQSASPGVTYAQTDRPVYRPGQNVNFRAILRRGYEDAYRIPGGTHRVSVTDSSGTKVWDHELRVSEFGTLAGAVPLAPSARLGMYEIAIDGRDVQSFAVEAYKKPEYVVDATPQSTAIVSGTDARVTVQANYLFGRPAAGMHVHYQVGSNWYWWQYYDPFGGSSDAAGLRWKDLPNTSGDAVTDAHGALELRVPTTHLPHPYSVWFTIEARDDSGRTVSTRTSLMAYPAQISLDLSPDTWFAPRGSDVALTVRSTDLKGKAVGNTRVQLTFTREYWDERTYKEHHVPAGSTVMTTAADGTGIAHWRPAQAGSYLITAQARDADGNLSETSRSVWVMGGDESWMPPTEQPLLVPARRTLGPNERPRVLVRMPAPGRDVLIAVVSDRVRSLHVLHVTGYAASLRLDAPPNASRFTVEAFLPSENGVAEADVQFQRATPKRLHIVLRANRKRYKPGDRAVFDAYVTDASGKPVRTELSIGIVDNGIYAVQADNTADAVSAFYGNTAYVSSNSDWYRPNYVPPPMGTEQGVPQGRALKTIARVASRGNLVKPGAAADMYSASGGPVKIRTNFQDTAYWTPAVVTDARGHARIAFEWPDNLTTWRTSALGVTAGTDVGQAHMETLVTKNFLVRLETPRFLRAGDRSTITGIAQGQKDAPHVRLALDAGGDLLRQALTLDVNQSAAASWPFDAGTLLGEKTFTLTGSDGKRSDGMQLTLPVESIGAAEHVRDAGSIGANDTLTVALPPGYDAGMLRLTLTPSIAAQLLQNVRMLDVYPYYCTEQTMSAALPAVFVDRLFRRWSVQLPSDMAPAKVIAHAIDRLTELQHADGSWGWWEEDPAHPFMTAYAMYGLAEFRKDGYAVPPAMFERGLHSLIAQLAGANTDTLRFWGGAQPGSEWNTRAFMLFALADAAPERVDRALLSQTLRHARSLNPYALSVLGLTYHELGDDQTARTILVMLDAKAISKGPYTYWSGDTWHYAWEDDPIETTAYALRLNAALEPNSAIVERTVAFLRSQQRGSWWYTTKDTAAAVYAIAQAVHPAQDEMHPDETITVLAGGRAVRTIHITSPVLSAADAEVDVPASVLQNGTQIELARSGRGALYWSSDFTRYAPWSVHAVNDSSRSLFARLFPKRPPLTIERRYEVDHPGPWRVGDIVHVSVTVRAREDVQYVAIEDPYPAGVEYAPPQGEAASSWSGVQFFDDRAVFFADKLFHEWPLRLSYDLRVTTQGTYAAPPPVAYAMYGPPVSATGSGLRVTVEP